jgi:hypothetical protein
MFDDICDRLSFCQLGEDVNVVCHSANDQGRALQAFEHLG